MANLSKLASKLYLTSDLSPESRDINYKGRFKQVFRTVGANMSHVVLVNLLTAIFALPLLLVMFFWLPKEVASAISGLNLSGGLGIGYGTVDQTSEAIRLIYNLRIEFFLYYFTPGMILLGVGMAGAYHCLRNFLWGTQVKVFKHFARGIQRHWWKFVLTLGYMGLVTTSTVTGFFFLLRDIAVNGSAGAGIWVWVVASCILALASLIYCVIAMPTYVCYKMSFKNYINNTFILAVLMGLPTIFLLASVAIPVLLSQVQILSFIVYIFMLTFGAAIYILMNLAFGQYVNDAFVRTLDEHQKISAKKQQEKEARAKNQQKKKAKANTKRR